MNNIFDNPYLRAGVKGLTFGLSEPVGAALASGMSYLAPQGGRPMTFQEAYAAEVAKREAERQQNPMGMSLAELAGAMPSAMVAGATAPLNPLVGGAMLGGLYGGLESRTPAGAAMGAGLGLGGAALGKMIPTTRAADLDEIANTAIANIFDPRATSKSIKRNMDIAIRAQEAQRGMPTRTQPTMPGTKMPAETKIDLDASARQVDELARQVIKETSPDFNALYNQYIK